MKIKIDKDPNLFFPKEFNFLLLGGNFLFSKRLYEIMKRNFDIKRIDHEHNYTQEYFSCISDTTFNIHLESYNKIQGLINLHNSDTLIFTSEIFLFLSNEKYLQFIDVLKQIKKSNIKLIFIAITNPLHICKTNNGKTELTNMSSKNWYRDRLKQIEKLLDSKTDLVYRFSSYCTYVNSNLQTNPIEVLDNNSELFDICQAESLNEFLLHLADTVIDDIILNVAKTNVIEFKNNILPSVTLSYIQTEFIKTDLYSYINRQKKCPLNLIYRKKPHEITNDNSVANWRYKLGCALGKNIPTNIVNELDIIIPIPETGKYYAQGLAHQLNKPYVEAFYKQSEIGRSFDINNVDKRTHFINSKLGLIPDLINGKNIGLVDEAIFTGQTLKIVRNLLKTTSVEKIYFFIGSPVCKNKCKFNMQPNRDLLAQHMTLNDLASYFEVNHIVFQDLNSFKDILSLAGFEHICCFSK